MKMVSVQTRTILGIDPGLRVAGYAVIGCDGGSARLLDLSYLQQSSSDPLMKRVGRFYRFVESLCEKYSVTDVALETPYLGRNAQTFLKLGYLRGSVYVIVHERGLGLYEFSPSQIKKAVTGTGRADKEQISRALMMLFPPVMQVKEAAVNDVTDALGIALCGAFSLSRRHLDRL